MNFTEEFRTWRRYRKTVAELNTYSNRELSDLGLSRADIREVAKQSVR